MHQTPYRTFKRYASMGSLPIDRNLVSVLRSP